MIKIILNVFDTGSQFLNMLSAGAGGRRPSTDRHKFRKIQLWFWNKQNFQNESFCRYQISHYNENDNFTQ